MITNYSSILNCTFTKSISCFSISCYDILNKLDLLIEHKIKVEEERNVLQQENERYV